MSPSPSTHDMVIFARTFDLLAWLVPRADAFPRAARRSVTARLLGAALDCVEALHAANARRGADRLAHLQAADGHLDVLRLYLRLVHEWRWLSDGQYRHVSSQVAEIGRLLGGWQRQTAGA